MTVNIGKMRVLSRSSCIAYDTCSFGLVFTEAIISLAICCWVLFSSGLGRLSQAEEYLAQAQWTVLKTPECTDGIRSKLFRNLGLLYAAQGNYPDALSQLADDVSSCFCSKCNAIM